MLEQASAQALALAVRGDDQASELGDGLPSKDADGGDQTPLLANSPSLELEAREVGLDRLEGLGQWRQVEVVMEPGLAEVGRSLQGQEPPASAADRASTGVCGGLGSSRPLRKGEPAVQTARGPSGLSGRLGAEVIAAAAATTASRSRSPASVDHERQSPSHAFRARRSRTPLGSGTRGRGFHLRLRQRSHAQGGADGDTGTKATARPEPLGASHRASRAGCCAA